MACHATSTSMCHATSTSTCHAMSTSTCYAMSSKLTPQDDMSFHVNVHMSCHISSFHVNQQGWSIANGRVSRDRELFSLVGGDDRKPIDRWSRVGRISEEFHSPMEFFMTKGRVSSLGKVLCSPKENISCRWSMERKSITHSSSDLISKTPI
jgi:hypothetical protein